MIHTEKTFLRVNPYSVEFTLLIIPPFPGCSETVVYLDHYKFLRRSDRGSRRVEMYFFVVEEGNSFRLECKTVDLV